jgi:hypothetical protein
MNTRRKFLKAAKDIFALFFAPQTLRGFKNI